MAGLLDFLSPEAGQRRRQWLNQQEDRLGGLMSYYLGPSGLDRNVNAVNELLNPVIGIEDAGTAAQAATAPGLTPGERFGHGLESATHMAGSLAPVAAGKIAGTSASEAAQAVDAITGGLLRAPAAKAAGQTIVERATQTNPNAPTTLYSNPLTPTIDTPEVPEVEAPVRGLIEELENVDTPPAGSGSVRGEGHALPPRLAVRGPTGDAPRPVPSGPHGQAYERAGAGVDADATGRGTLTPTEEGRAAYSERLRDFEPVEDLDAFHQSQLAAQTSHGAIGKAVSIYPPDYLKENGYRAFMTPDGSVSFAISPEGEVASLVAHKTDADPGAVDAALGLAVQEGGDWLQAFDTVLPQMYGEHGFRPSSRLPYNREVAAGDWGEEAADAFEETVGEPDLVFMHRDPSFTGRNAPGSGGRRTDDWDTAQAILDADVDTARTARTPQEAAYVAPRATGQSDGSLGLPPDQQVDVTWDGKQPGEWTPQDWHDFGAAHGTPNLGPENAAEWQANLRQYDTEAGEVSIPAGTAEDPFTYYDLLHIKAQGIDPNKIPPELHDEIHRRMVAGVSQNPLTDDATINGFLMGMISPNQPLTPNELALQRAMIKGPQDLERLAGMGGYDYRGRIPPLADPKPGKRPIGPLEKTRQQISREITPQLGVQAAGQGGLGVSGSANWADISEMAQKFRDRPDFYRMETRDYGDVSDSQKWAQFVTEIMNETRGLKAKTGSFSSVWQDPENAAISAIDRHMATLFKNEMFPSQKAMNDWRKKTIDAYNKQAREKGQKTVRSWPQFEDAPGARGVFVEQVMGYVNNMKGSKTMLRGVTPNPEVAKYLHEADWVSASPPEKIEQLGAAYVRALEANDERAAKDALGLFSSQWKEWDKIRGRIEPHEIMFRGLENLPRMSQRQMEGVKATHKKAGYLAGKNDTDAVTALPPVRRVPRPSDMGYFGLGGLGLMNMLEQREDRQRDPTLLGGNI